MMPHWISSRASEPPLSHCTDGCWGDSLHACHALSHYRSASRLASRVFLQWHISFPFLSMEHLQGIPSLQFFLFLNVTQYLTAQHTNTSSNTRHGTRRCANPTTTTSSWTGIYTSFSFPSIPLTNTWQQRVPGSWPSKSTTLFIRS